MTMQPDFRSMEEFARRVLVSVSPRSRREWIDAAFAELDAIEPPSERFAWMAGAIAVTVAGWFSFFSEPRLAGPVRAHAWAVGGTVIGFLIAMVVRVYSGYAPLTDWLVLSALGALIVGAAFAANRTISSLTLRKLVNSELIFLGHAALFTVLAYYRIGPDIVSYDIRFAGAMVASLSYIAAQSVCAMRLAQQTS